MVQYQIYHADTTDAENLVRYLNIIGGETNFLSFGEGDFYYSVEEEAKYIAQMQKNKNGVMLVVKDDNNNIIAESICISSIPNYKRLSHVFTIPRLTVKKKYWGNGIGSNLIKKIEEEAKKLGGKKIMLHVYEHNKKAIKLYKKLGFELEGLLKKHVKIENEYINTYIMSKFL